MDWLIERLKEKSTWVGVVSAAAGVVGWSVDPEMAKQVGTVGVAAVGLVLMLMRERGSKK